MRMRQTDRPIIRNESQEPYQSLLYSIMFHQKKLFDEINSQQYEPRHTIIDGI